MLKVSPPNASGLLQMTASMCVCRAEHLPNSGCQSAHSRSASWQRVLAHPNSLLQDVLYINWLDNFMILLNTRGKKSENF